MGERRLIGIDLAWGKRDGSEPKGSGCAELVWKDDELELKRFDLLGRVGEIIKWLQPDGGDWVAAIDAPLVICNKTGQRPAEKQASHYYGCFEANADSASLKNPNFGEHYQGRMIRKQLKELGGTLVERVEHLGDGPLFFETYPHVAMVELFRLERTIKYKRGWVNRHYPREERFERQLEGVQQLVGQIREHLCASDARPRLLPGDNLDELLGRPASSRSRADLDRCGDLLDGLVCAYTAAWLDLAGRDRERGDGAFPLAGLGEVGEGVMIVPGVLGIGPALG